MLEIKNISVDVSDEGDSREILKNVSLHVEEGKLVALTGPNGGGKSTLARVIVGITLPSSGSVLLDGEDITSLSVTERAEKGIGFAFQQPVRFRGLTVRDLLSISAGRDASDEMLCACLRDVGLCAQDYLEREVGAALSGGEIKRIEIATVLARGARLALFDEPEAGIDLWSFGNLIGVFERLKRTLHGSVLVITHQQRILEIADEIVVLAQGSVSMRGAAKDILPSLLGGDAPCRFCTHEPNERQRRNCQ